MNLKGRLIEFLIVNDLVPVQTRWRKSSSSVGRMFNDVFHMLDKNERAGLTKMMYSWGLEDANEIVGILKIKRNLHGCAVTLMGMHHIFGIKSHIAEENADEIKIHATKCMWNNKKDWTPQVCASIDGYERGLAEGLIRIYYTSARKEGVQVINSASLF